MHKFIYLPKTIREVYLQTVKKTASINYIFRPDSRDDPIVIPPRHFPCQAFFLNSNLYLCSDEDEIDPGLTRNDFKEEEESFLDYEEGGLRDYFYVMLSEEKLKGLGIEVKTGEGWKWDAEKLRSIKVERSEGPNQAWCPATQEWEQHCDCAGCKQHQKPDNYYVRFNVIKSIYNGLPCHLKFEVEVGNPLAVFANRCTLDRSNY